MVLIQLQQGDDLTAQVMPPSAGFRAGSDYQVNFMFDNGILAQSDQFNITAGTSTLSANGGAGTYVF
jgi:hypothetical protein